MSITRRLNLHNKSKVTHQIFLLGYKNKIKTLNHYSLQSDEDDHEIFRSEGNRLNKNTQRITCLVVKKEITFSKAWTKVKHDEMMLCDSHQ